MEERAGENVRVSGGTAGPAPGEDGDIFVWFHFTEDEEKTRNVRGVCGEVTAPLMAATQTRSCVHRR